MKKKIGILGGTFNPPHIGHLRIAVILRDEFGLDEVVFLPVGAPPHKKGEYIASAFDRLNMLSIMTAGYPFMSVSDIETKRPGLTYTVDTLTQLAAIIGKTADLFYIIGSDTLLELKNWKNCLKVFQLTSFICIFRPGDLHEEMLAEKKRLEKEFCAKIFISANSGPDISSTAIRREINQGRTTGLIDKKVMEYIVHNHVFG